MAKGAGRRVETLVIRTARETGGNVVNDAISENVGAIVAFVAQVRKLRPARGVRLRNPQMVNWKAAIGIAITKHDETLAKRAVVIQQSGKAR